jgi:hypothetical protein
MNLDWITEHPPNAEAKATAIQLRKTLFAMLEAGIDNRWQDVVEGAHEVAILAQHCADIEASYAPPEDDDG